MRVHMRYSQHESGVLYELVYNLVIKVLESISAIRSSGSNLSRILHCKWTIMSEQVVNPSAWTKYNANLIQSVKLKDMAQGYFHYFKNISTQQLLLFIVLLVVKVCYVSSNPQPAATAFEYGPPELPRLPPAVHNFHGLPRLLCLIDEAIGTPPFM